MAENPKPIAVTLGDASGVGPDIILDAWSKREKLELPKFIVVGSGKVLEERAKKLGIRLHIAPAFGPGSENGLPVAETGFSCIGSPGEPSVEDAGSTIGAIEQAVDMTLGGQCRSIVTCPINKHIVYQAGFEHPGHTEFLAELAIRKTGQPCVPVMMLAGPDLKTVPVTVHIALSRVPESLTTEMILEKGRITASALKAFFGKADPVLAVSGLNPHAGENGNMGIEDLAIIKPAIEALKSENIRAVGPLPADTMFHATARQAYDAALCMYHDQALIPAKTLAFDDAVNVTLGLPFVRTSPDHGTAYEIAGTGKARSSSFVAALRMADAMTRPDPL